MILILNKFSSLLLKKIFIEFVQKVRLSLKSIAIIYMAEDGRLKLPSPKGGGF